MRVGILTLHDSPNYGAVLQAYALRSYLTACGHEAFVIDRRREGGAMSLRTPPHQRDSVRLLGLVRADAHNGARAYARRCERTQVFLDRQVRLSPYRFHAWRDAPRDLGLDVIVVGSDQVWNANNLDPADYLLKDVPGSPRGVAYAASLGLPEIPTDLQAEYKSGFARFAALGVRERAAADRIRALGFAVEHVVDPVLLAGREAWPDVDIREGSERIFAYFLAEDFSSMVPELGAFARQTGRRVDFLVDWFVRKAPHGLGGYLRNRRFERKAAAAGVDFRLDDGPAEFVRRIAAADVVVSNSYHALMFALLFGKDVRIVLPTHPVRRKMNARLSEFEGPVVDGPLVHGSLAAALGSFERDGRLPVRTEELAARIRASREWLATALEGRA